MVLSFRQKPFQNFAALGLFLMHELLSYISNFNQLLARSIVLEGADFEKLKKCLYVDCIVDE